MTNNQSPAKIPLNLIIFSSTKGHFGIKTRYLETIKSLNQQIPLSYFSQRFLHIKVSSGEKEICYEMENNVKLYDFEVIPDYGDWSHGNLDHQIGYLNDMNSVYYRGDVNSVQYSLVMEDDFLIKTYDKDLLYYLNKGVSILEEMSNIVQVRIPRFTNEFDRVNNLKAKHNINGIAKKINGDDEIFALNDWSNNVHISRTRDLRIALLLMRRNQDVFPPHSEHGVSLAMKYLSLTDTPFVCFNPKLVRCGHCGTLRGEEDNLDKELNAT